MSLTITLRNISWQPGKPVPATCDYQYEVFVNTRCIERGHVRGHNRCDGWDGLMLLLGSERAVAETYGDPYTLPPPPPRKVLQK